MSNPDERRIIQFDQLNLLGKAVFLAGATVRTTAQLIDVALEKTTDVWIEAERAFQAGLDPNVDEAKVLREWDKEDESTSSS